MKKIISILLITVTLVFTLTACGLDLFDDNDSNNNDNSSNKSEPVVTLSSAYYSCGCEYPYASLGDSYITVDTNPYDYDSESSSSTKYASSALSAIQKLNSEFGFPSYVYEDMKTTRALDGRQNYSNSNFTVAWTYHPDSGLEVRYAKVY